MTTKDSSPKKSRLKNTTKVVKQAQTVVIKSFKNRVIPKAYQFSKTLKEQYQQIDIKNEPKHRRFFVATVTLFIMWLFLVGTLSFSEILVGLLVSIFTVWLSSNHLTFIDNIIFSRTMPWHIVLYLQVFVVALIRANLDMARRVLSPSLPINPALVEVETKLQSSLGKLLLANSITLTPGTLTVDVIGDRLQVHWVDSTPGVDLEKATHVIAESFERHLRGFLQ
jgi:multicomponent Na+:H+ antiporter subunit E